MRRFETVTQDALISLQKTRKESDHIMSVAFNSDVDLTVEIAFDSEPFATSQTFTDVSAYVREFSIDRGRQHDLADFQTGTASQFFWITQMIGLIH